ncbi:hypothetical protein BD413DRAFT_612695 [Trametes elegans]|nr:hypothetical protein BD413DRAFT_612695 [Trametes elegans]
MNNHTKNNTQTVPIERLERLAEDEVQALDELASNLPQTAKPRDVEGWNRRIIEGAGQVVNFLGGIASIFPWAEPVMNAFSCFIHLELQRRENDALIAGVSTAVVNTIYHLRFLRHVKIHDLEKDFNFRMSLLLNNLAGSIKEYAPNFLYAGKFVDAYHHHCWQRTCQYFFAHHYEKKLHDFAVDFDKHRQDLDDMHKSATQLQLINIQTNMSNLKDHMSDIQASMSDIRANAVVLLRRLKADHSDSNKVDALIESKGYSRDVENNPSPKVIDEVAAFFKEKATPKMKQVLQGGFDDLLEKHTARYSLKLASVQGSILGSVSSSQQAILHAGFKSSVKSRVFVHELHEHYRNVFRDYDSPVMHEDMWTLEFFSRAMYYSTIGDVLDGDGSGDVYASEVNDFKSEKRCLSHWSTPESFAFWACGWYNNNALYHRRTKDIVEELETFLKQVSAHSHGSWHLVRGITHSLGQLALIADVEDFSSVVTVPHQLRRLQDEYRRHEEENMNAKLASFGCHLVDRSSLRYIVGDTRIELHMMPLLCILMSRFRDAVFKNSHHGQIKNDDIVTIEELATSCIAVCAAFENRMTDLVRGWRFGGLDIGLQIDRFASGLFKRCYREVGLPDCAENGVV